MNRVILGCGYIGKALLEHWQSDQKLLVATTTQFIRQKELEPLANEVIVLWGDDRLSLKKLFSNAKQIIICVAPKRGESYEKAYLDTAQAICKVLREGSPVEQVVYTSSISVYGSHQGEWVTEESELRTEAANGKILCETESLYLTLLPTSIFTTILRLGGIYGPQREHEKRARQMAGSVCLGNGEHFSNWVHQKDIVRAIDWVLKKRLSGTYNVCSEDHPTRKQFYEEILGKLALPPIQWDLAQEGPHSGNKRVSSEKLINTGFKFFHKSL